MTDEQPLKISDFIDQKKIARNFFKGFLIGFPVLALLSYFSFRDPDSLLFDLFFYSIFSLIFSMIAAVFSYSIFLNYKVSKLDPDIKNKLQAQTNVPQNFKKKFSNGYNHLERQRKLGPQSLSLYWKPSRDAAAFARKIY